MNSGLTDQHVMSIAIYPGFPQNGTIVASTASGSAFITGNRGATWTTAAAIRRALSPQTNTHLRYVSTGKTGPASAAIFLATFEGLWKSVNRGASWSYVDLMAPNLIRVLLLSSN
jgi:hypothetical protein